MHEIKIKPQPWKPLILLILNLAFVAMGIYLLIDKQNQYGWFTIVFFGICAIISLLQLIPNSNYLLIHPKGLTIKTFLNTTELEWKDIKNISSKKILFNTFTILKFSDDFHGKFLNNKIDSILTNKEGLLPNSFGMNSEKLCRILNEYKSNIAS